MNYIGICFFEQIEKVSDTVNVLLRMPKSQGHTSICTLELWKNVSALQYNNEVLEIPLHCIVHGYCN